MPTTRHARATVSNDPRVSKGLPAREFASDGVHPRIVFRIASVCNASSYDRSRPRVRRTQGWNTRTETSRAAHRHSRRHVAREYIKGQRAGVQGWLSGPYRLELGRYNRPGSATKFGNLKGRATNWDGGSEAGQVLGHVLRFRKYFSYVVSEYGTVRRGEARRGEVK